MKNLIDTELIENCRNTNIWDLGNQVLYDLCTRNFSHKSDEEILAKVWLIGRSYSVSVERRKNSKDINDFFYINKIIPAFKNSELDLKLNELTKYNEINIDSLKESLEVHNYLIEVIHKPTEQFNRSFSSKYLHFHLPNLFFIYDTRAASALRQFVKQVPEDLKSLGTCKYIDKEYAIFACKCFHLQRIIFEKKGIQLSTRQLDNLFLAIANDMLESKKKFIKNTY